MARNLTDYFTRRISEEELAAAAATHPGVKARHTKTDDRNDFDGLFPA